MVKVKINNVDSRKPKYPVISLDEAIEKARALFDNDGTAGSTREAAYKHLGYKKAHGKSITVLASLEKYGLTQKDNKRIMLTKDAVLILLPGGEEKKRFEAIKRCALRPELYSKLWNQYSGELPGDDTLKSQLVTEFNYSPKLVDSVIRDFRKTIKFAHLDSKAEKPTERPKNKMGETMPEMSDIITPTEGQQEAEKPVMRDYLIPRKGDKVAILRLESPVDKKDIDGIKKWIDTMEEILFDIEVKPPNKNKDQQIN